jgi:hypothetical protein
MKSLSCSETKNCYYHEGHEVHEEEKRGRKRNYLNNRHPA